MNEAQKLMGNLGVQSKEQKRLEMAGAITRLVINEALKEAKQRAAVRDAAMAPQKADDSTKNG